ncbi:McrB family protein [Paenibacillus agricola]|uniref:ATPase dynein-related AAA domain-containing protein n=1 Tax=Paenibacillus agricola TaxID=2716264 RepID=A0ABX0JG99_9BACL|nr:hypothetical protein [Paenibacillus agricola]NHN34405.1 hypothetical protein [Paenibacillus agricola]
MFEVDKMMKSQLLESNTNLLLGVLATNPEDFPKIGETQEAVTQMKNSNKVCFFVKPISSQPEPIIELDHIHNDRDFSTLYIGIEDSFPRNLMPTNITYTTDIEGKVKKVKDKLDGKIIVFRPRVIFTTEGKVFKNIDIISIEDGDVPLNTEYLPVPLAPDRRQFEQSLKESKMILFKDFYHNMFQPDYVISEDYLYYFNDGWKKDPSRKNGWMFTAPTEVRKIKIDQKVLRVQQVIGNPGSLVFISEDYLFSLKNEFMKEGMSIYEAEDETIDPHATLTAEALKIPIQSTEPVSKPIQAPKFSALPSSDAHKLELQFLSEMEKQAIAKKLCYEKEDLINFHVSVKTNPITILSGMSGTGKSQLALIYAKTLGLSKDEGNLLVLPISPSYTEPEDIIGFHNTSTGLYVPSETGLIDFLIHAKNYKEQMHMVIFDEMNLSQVEYWFSPFISLLEMDQEESYRELKLWSKDTVCHNSAKYPATISIGENVIFIGTANMDETTKDFSDRLLDRANIVTPQKMKFSAHRQALRDMAHLEQVNSDFVELFRNRGIYRSWNSNSDAWAAFSDDELVFFDGLHDIIQKYDKQKGISFRALERIGMFLNNIPLDENGQCTIARDTAIDLQVKQRILTKIRGSSEVFGGLIGTLSVIGGSPQGSELFELFTSTAANGISHFILTQDEIKRKARELYINDFAS